MDQSLKYKCSYCGRLMKEPVPHICNHNYRKKHLKFINIMKLDSKEIEELIHAFNEGKKLEWKDDNGIWFDITCLENLLKVLAGGYKARIKDEPKYRPYSDAREFSKACLFHGKFLFHKDFPEIGLFPIKCDSDGVFFVNEPKVSYKDLLDHYIWSTGHHCGVLKENEERKI